MYLKSRMYSCWISCIHLLLAIACPSYFLIGSFIELMSLAWFLSKAKIILLNWTYVSLVMSRRLNSLTPSNSYLWFLLLTREAPSYFCSFSKRKSNFISIMFCFSSGLSTSCLPVSSFKMLLLKSFKLSILSSVKVIIPS